MAAPVLQFEKHAGVVLKNQNAHIFLRNGTSLYELFHALRVVLADRFSEAFRMAAGAPMTVPAVNGALTEQGQRLEQQPASRELDGLQAVDVTAEQAPQILDMLTEEERVGLCLLDLRASSSATESDPMHGVEWPAAEKIENVADDDQAMPDAEERRNATGEQPRDSCLSTTTPVKVRVTEPKYQPESFLEDVRGLLSTGLLEGFRVTYKKNEVEMTGRINGQGYSCGCSECGYRQEGCMPVISTVGDHMALVRAYEGWKDVEREGSGYEYCWRNFLSAQTLQAIHSLRKQFSYILKDAGLIDLDTNTNNNLSHNQSLVCGIICSGLFPGIASVVHRESSMSFKTMDDGQVLLYANSVNAKYQTIPYPWLVFGEKVKVNAVFIRDSTGVSDSILILFGGAVTKGSMAGHLKMLDGYIDLFMDPCLSECYLQLKEELDKLIQQKLEYPCFDIHKEGKYILFAAQELAAGDLCEGRFVFGRETSRARLRNEDDGKSNIVKDGMDPKSL